MELTIELDSHLGLLPDTRLGSCRMIVPDKVCSGPVPATLSSSGVGVSLWV